MSFKQKIRAQNRSLVVTIPNEEVRFNNYKEGDWVEVEVKKTTKVWK